MASHLRGDVFPSFYSTLPKWLILVDHDFAEGVTPPADMHVDPFDPPVSLGADDGPTECRHVVCAILRRANAGITCCLRLGTMQAMYSLLRPTK